MNNLDKLVNDNIILIIECCKTSQDSKLIEEKISLIKNWDDFISLSYSHGVFPLVYKSIKKYDEKIPLDKLSFMKQTYMDVVKQNMLMTSELINILKLLEEHDIEAIPFKGPTLSLLAYGDIISRQYSDLDILVHEKNLVKAYNIIKYNNFSTLVEEKFVNNQLFLEKNSDIQFINKKNNIVLELHWKLFRKQFLSNLSNIELFKSFNYLYVNEEKVRIFEIEILIVYLCMHGSKHNWERIEWILDIDRLVRNFDYINWELVFYFSKKNSCYKMLNLGLLLSQKIFDTPIPNNFIEKMDKDFFQKNIFFVINEMKNISLNKTEFQENLTSLKFTYNLNDNLKDKIYFLKRVIFELSHSDVNFLHLNKSLYFLYYLIKPFRLFIKYVKKI